MKSSQEQQTTRSLRQRRPSGVVLGIAATALVFTVSLVAMALAAGGGLTITSASNATLGERIAVDAQGRTLYALRPETSRHLLCKSSECLKFWPPLSVRSSKAKLQAGPGVHGRLAILRRSNGALQVTLGGLPLYRYSGDHAKGEANGQNIHSFGGTWHVLSATSNASTPAPTTPTAPATPTTPTPPATPTTPTTPTSPSTPTTPGYGY